MMLIPAPPEWNPKEKTSPLKEEYLLFYKETTQYHYLITGALDNHPDLAAKLPNIPDSLESFTDKTMIVVGGADLAMHIYKVLAIYAEKRPQHDACATSSSTLSGTASTNHNRLKVVLPTPFDSSTARAWTFLVECKNYIDLSWSQFPSDTVKIQWALQLCTDKAATWKQIQMDLADEYEVPEHLLDWAAFQQEF